MKTVIFLILLILPGSFIGLSKASTLSINTANPKRMTGKIWDADTRIPLANVNVTFYHSKDSTLVAGTISNNDGNFCIAAPDPGNCYIIISYSGFGQQVISLASIEEYQNHIRLGDFYLTKLISQNIRSNKR